MHPLEGGHVARDGVATPSGVATSPGMAWPPASFAAAARVSAERATIPTHAPSEASARAKEHTWLKENAPDFGWDNPDWARSGGSGPYEPWHWEYVAGQDDRS